MPTFTAQTLVGTPADSVGGSITATAESFIQQDYSLAASGTPVASALHFVTTKLSMLYLKSSVACSVAFKNGSDVSGTVALVANEPFFWAAAGQNPATAVADIFDLDVDNIAITNTSNPLAAGTLQIRVLVDPT